jgi:hypothetical protein
MPNFMHNSVNLISFANIWLIITNKRLQFNKTSQVFEQIKWKLVGVASKRPYVLHQTILLLMHCGLWSLESPDA